MAERKSTATPGRTFTLPHGCKPSEGCERSGMRPVIAHGYLRRRDGDLWLFTTDSYLAIALRVKGDATEGWVPFDVLRLMESDGKRPTPRLTFEQVDFRTWKVSAIAGSTVTTYTAVRVLKDSKFPDLDAVSNGALFKPHDAEPASAFGMNPEFMGRIGKALGGPIRVSIAGATDPLSITAIGHADRRALQMPVRLLEERGGELKAAA